MTVSPFDHPFLSGLLGNDEVAALFSADADIQMMLRFESALAQAEAVEGVIPQEAAQRIAEVCSMFQPDMASLASATARDGVVVPELVRQLRLAVGEPHGEHVHFAATSQDVIDTSLVMRLKQAIAVIERRIGEVGAKLADLSAKDGHKAMIGRTRMRNALQITAARRIRSWSEPLENSLNVLKSVQPGVLMLQFGGPVGMLQSLEDNGPKVARTLGEILDLDVPPHSWHELRSGIARFASWLSLVTGSLGKMGQDITLMAQDEIGEVILTEGGGSSVLTKKINPVRAEILVALARFNAVQLSAMHQSMVHENERSGAAWTVEWMILPQMVVATAAALESAGRLLASIELQHRTMDAAG
ncbi:MAG TPA: 3-carboxy-cis,cis-muconate cycloisomerase [Afifellaceae bacterium]|nr:3-carboxy-cis,cis-muconate cycloisomerase [Afifellaceae bacterium]